MDNILIQLQQVGKSYDRPNSSNVSILEGIHLNIAEGEFVSILGPSGSGIYPSSDHSRTCTSFSWKGLF